jgi:hypothetical protein
MTRSDQLRWCSTSLRSVRRWQGANPEECNPGEFSLRQALCADIDGCTLHTKMRCESHDRKRLEYVGRYITRPVLLKKSVQLNAVGKVESKLKTPR